MDKIYTQNDGTPVYDLDIDVGGSYTMTESESKFLSDVQEFTAAGFRIAHKDKFPTKAGPNRDIDYDRYQPEASLVANNNSSGAAIENGMLFLHSGLESRDGVFLYMALDGNETHNFIDPETNRLKGFDDATLVELDDGNHFGYVKLERNVDAMPGHEFEDSLLKLREMALPAVPIPFSRDAMEFLPFFGREGMEPDSLEPEDMANILKNSLRNEISAIEIPAHILSNSAESNDYDYSRDNSFRRRM
jgi:hypothetical protein